METEKGCAKTNIIAWNEDWNTFKRMFKTASRLNGTADAIQVRKQVAEGLSWPPEVITGDFTKRAIVPSPILAAMLTLSLYQTSGVEQSILTEELEEPLSPENYSCKRALGQILYHANVT